MPWQGKTELTLTGTVHSQPEGVEKEEGKKKKSKPKRGLFFKQVLPMSHYFVVTDLSFILKYQGYVY